MATENLYFLRRGPSTVDGTFGRIMDNAGNVICCTCERPWENNEAGLSCIPAGVYQVIPHNSPTHPDTWEITAVPARSGILIHTGNFDTQSEGCVLVGNTFGVVDGKPAVLNSVSTMNKLREILPLNFTLTVT